MKIDLITYTRTKNYGGILQAYGLYSYLQSCGYDVQFIDYIPPRCNIENKKVYTEQMTSLSRIWGKSSFTKKLWQFLCYPGFKKGFVPFKQFLDQRTNFTHPYYSFEELQQDPPKADIYMTGSDQVWNSAFCRDHKLDRPYYLGFVSDGKKISYASSFGTNSIPEAHKSDVKSYLSQYTHLSVREQSGCEILQELGLDGTVTVDPTLLCDRGVWEQLLQPVSEKNYILLYQVKFDQKIYNLAKQTAKESGKKLITVSMNEKDRRYIHQNLILSPTIPQWLSYIRSADGVITDSFHASVFSILFHRPFVVNSVTRKAMASRIINLLRMADLEGQELNTYDADLARKILIHPINWTDSDQHIENKRAESRKWLANAIEN